jgi:hypothetical protein
MKVIAITVNMYVVKYNTAKWKVKMNWSLNKYYARVITYGQQWNYYGEDKLEYNSNIGENKLATYAYE